MYLLCIISLGSIMILSALAFMYPSVLDIIGLGAKDRAQQKMDDEEVAAIFRSLAESDTENEKTEESNIVTDSYIATLKLEKALLEKAHAAGKAIQAGFVVPLPDPAKEGVSDEQFYAQTLAEETAKNSAPDPINELFADLFPNSVPIKSAKKSKRKPSNVKKTKKRKGSKKK